MPGRAHEGHLPCLGSLMPAAHIGAGPLMEESRSLQEGQSCCRVGGRSTGPELGDRSQPSSARHGRSQASGQPVTASVSAGFGSDAGVKEPQSGSRAAWVLAWLGHGLAATGLGKPCPSLGFSAPADTMGGGQAG